MTNKKIITKKVWADITLKAIVFLLAFSTIILLLLMFSLILKEAFPAYEAYGFFNIYFGADFSEQGNWGVWGALFVTIFTSFIAILIAMPIALRAAIFIRYRLKYGQKTIRMTINILAGIPSVIFGIFALTSLRSIGGIVGINSATTIFNSVLTLIIMIFPTLVVLLLNQLYLVPNDVLDASLALGKTKTSTIYKIIKKTIRQGIFISSIVGLGRVIGETMALSMILTTSPLDNPLTHGVTDFLNSSGASLGVMIARLMFTDSSNPAIRSALFASGLFLFVVTIGLVIGMTKLSKNTRLINTNPFTKPNKTKMSQTVFYIKLAWHFIFIPFKMVRYALVFTFQSFSLMFGYVKYWLAIPINYLFLPKIKREASPNYFLAVANYPFAKIGDYTRIFLEVISLTTILCSIGWIGYEIFVRGIPNWQANYWVWSYQDMTEFGLINRPGVIANSLVFTLVLLGLSVTITLPIAFAIAIYLSEYAHNKKNGTIIKFFIDSIGGTPSIIFGLFGVVFFRQILNIGNGGFSIIAGSLTMVIVILPTFTRAIEQVLVNIPMDIRYASYALGASKSRTIFKVVMPRALSGVVTGVILAMGRVIAETAPIYLTIGMMGNVVLDLNSEGWTMTTKIFYNQVYSTMTSTEAINQSYAIASAAFILVLVIILLAEAVQTILNNKHLIRKKIREFNLRHFQGKKTNLKNQPHQKLISNHKTNLDGQF